MGDTTAELSLEKVKGAFGPLSLKVDDSFWQALLSLPSTREELISPELPEKASRTLFHQTIRNLFSGTIQTEAICDHSSDPTTTTATASAIDGENRIRIYAAKGNRSSGENKRRRDDRNTQPAGQHRFLQFRLYKESMDTIEVIQLMAKRLHMSQKDFSYAGTKDRRAITCQNIVVRNATVNKVLGINKLLSDGKLRVSNISLAKGPLALGDLVGNHFTVVIRDVQNATNEAINNSLDTFKANGFINYFGLQRFGTGSVGSHQIGLALLKQDWKGAIDLILKPRAGETDQRAIAARLKWAEGADARTVYSLFPYRFTAERQILAHFARDPANTNDLLGAILSINRELRLMYVHSVQSWIWNQLASRRICKHGMAVVEGDLVSVTEEDVDEGEGVKFVTAGDVLDAKYSIYDVVLPQPGYRTRFPTSILTESLQSELAKQGLDLVAPDEVKASMFRPKCKALWDLPGAYRKLIVKPENFSHILGYYDQLEGDLLASQLNPTSGLHHALIVSFTLPTSSYATMAIREFMRASTDPRLHARLTQSHLSTSPFPAAAVANAK